jgi:hypothetical protein
MMDTLAVALLLAIIALGIGIVVVLRERRSGKGGVPALVLVVGPVAGIIGMVPGVLRLPETVSVVASVVSSIMSLGVIGVLVAHLIRKRPD